MSRLHFRDLIAWQKSMELAVLIYRSTGSMPADERFGLTFQVRKAAVSVPSNIAEGSSRRTPGEFLQFLGIAQGSLAEVETQTELAWQLGFIDEKTSRSVLNSAAEVGRILSGLERSIDQGRPT